MLKKVVLGFVLLLVSCPVFAGGFVGIGGDAEFFPQHGVIGTAFVVPLLNNEGTGASSIFGIGAIVGWPDLSLTYQVGQQGSNQFGNLCLRKKVYGGEYDPFVLTLVLDMDSLYTSSAANGISYIGAVISKKVNDIYPYFGLFSATYLSSTDVGGVKVQNTMNGFAVGGGARYDFNEKLSGRAEVNYSSFNTTAALTWPKSVLSSSVVATYSL